MRIVVAMSGGVDSSVAAGVLAEQGHDVIGLSILSGAHLTHFGRVRELMEQEGLGDRLLTGGGIIPTKDQQSLQDKGVGRLFGPGDDLQAIVDYIRAWDAAAGTLEVPQGETVTLSAGTYQYEWVNIQGTLFIQGDVIITVTGPALDRALLEPVALTAGEEALP